MEGFDGLAGTSRVCTDELNVLPVALYRMNRSVPGVTGTEAFPPPVAGFMEEIVAYSMDDEIAEVASSG